MSHRDAEELAAEIAYMQDDPSFHPRYNPKGKKDTNDFCLLYTSPSPRDS